MIKENEMLEDMKEIIEQLRRSPSTDRRYLRQLEALIKDRKSDLLTISQKMMVFIDAIYGAAPPEVFNFTLSMEDGEYSQEELRAELKRGLCHLSPASLIGRVYYLCSREEKSLIDFKARASRYLDHLTSSDAAATVEFTMIYFGAMTSYISQSQEIKQVESIVFQRTEKQNWWDKQ